MADSKSPITMDPPLFERAVHAMEVRATAQKGREFSFATFRDVLNSKTNQIVIRSEGNPHAAEIAERTGKERLLDRDLMAAGSEKPMLTSMNPKMMGLEVVEAPSVKELAVTADAGAGKPAPFTRSPSNPKRHDLA